MYAKNIAVNLKIDAFDKWLLHCTDVHLKWDAFKWMSFLPFMILPKANAIKQNKEYRLKYAVRL